jgi:hypothetical protein
METYADNESVEAMLVERLTFWSDYGHYIPIYPRQFIARFEPQQIQTCRFAA